MEGENAGKEGEMAGDDVNLTLQTVDCTGKKVCLSEHIFIDRAEHLRFAVLHCASKGYFQDIPL